MADQNIMHVPILFKGVIRHARAFLESQTSFVISINSIKICILKIRLETVIHVSYHLLFNNNNNDMCYKFVTVILYRDFCL